MFKHFAGLIALSAALVPPVYAAELQPFSVSFNVMWHGMSAGRSKLELQKLPDGRWSYSSRSDAQGLFRLALPAELKSRSVFSIRNGQIFPEHFTGDDGTDSQRRDQDLVFDWERGRVTGTAEKQPVDLPTQSGLQDGMSIQVSLMHALLAGQAPTRVLMVDKTKIKEYVYSEEGTASIKTPLGVSQTIIYRSGRPDSPHGTWFWCDPQLGFLPVKVERRSGTSVEWSMTLESAKVGGT
ncbi:MAG: DUF3108 domain-containing protein [Pseudomonadota bacterium]